MQLPEQVAQHGAVVAQREHVVAGRSVLLVLPGDGRHGVGGGGAVGQDRRAPQGQAHRAGQVEHAHSVGAPRVVGMSDVLELAGVTVVRDGSVLLDEVDWSVADGVVWLLVV